MSSLDDFARHKVQSLKTKGLQRQIQTTERRDLACARQDGHDLISFCDNDYLNFTHHPYIKEKAKNAIDRYGTGAGASRLITGSHPLYNELEQRLARLKGTEACVIFGSGYLTNIGVIPTLIGPGDLMLADELSHNCLMAGGQLSRAAVKTFSHNDMTNLEAQLATDRANYRHCLIVTDGVFSMDGDLAPITQLARLAEQYDAWLMTDDAHGIGIMGQGRGSNFTKTDTVTVPLQMGTLSKAIGSYGGYLCASQAVIDLIQTRARSLIYTTGLPPAVIASSLAALDIIEQDPDYCARPMKNAALFCHLMGLPAPQSCIVPLLIGDTNRTMQYATALREEGFLVSGIRPPTVPEGTARLRITFSAAHSDDHIHALVNALRTLGLGQQDNAL
ncbi:MAG: 8-amino-7-oxononanoate synthase [Kordiimonas sp.]|nr:8-amino-7-oxononanoate synthase [Kordiimonas sp.]|tara:strand:+ start:3176 stop:4345 length:1170 start_codon:yes stop_codon:yes gene_type:complete